ncbi:MAG: FHA domain-containing protein [Fimbriimonadaceae bacterium]
MNTHDPLKTQFGAPVMDPNRTQLGAGLADPNRTVLGGSPTLDATQIVKPVQCPVCKAFNPAGVIFCIDCGLIFDRALPPDAFGAPEVRLPILVDSAGREHKIRPGTNWVGREGGDLVVSDPMVSRKHAEILLEGSTVRVQDHGSTNGTLVNGTALQPNVWTELKTGDRISFATTEYIVSVPGSDPARTQQITGERTEMMSAGPTCEAPESSSLPSASDESAPSSGYSIVWAGKSFPLVEGVNTLGRKSDSDVCIPDPYVSGRHCHIELNGGEIVVTDVGSTNGTHVNGTKLEVGERVQVTPKDEITIGSIVLAISSPETDE